jgi:hypothetical protein
MEKSGPMYVVRFERGVATGKGVGVGVGFILGVVTTAFALPQAEQIMTREKRHKQDKAVKEDLNCFMRDINLIKHREPDHIFR